jgi:glycosyltransferase involved in cell wall biosynthesis
LQRTRIIHAIGALVAGGAERSAKDLVVTMRRAGHPVELVALLPKMDEAGRQWKRELDEAGVPVRLGPVDHLRPPTVMWLARLLRAPDIRILHMHLSYVEVAYYGARFLHRRRYGVLRKIHSTRVPGGSHGWAFRHSDVRLYYSCGAAAHEAYRGHCKGEQILVPNGLAFDWPRNEASARDGRLAALGVDPAETHFINVGSHAGASVETAQKAQDTLIAAWRRAGMGERASRLHLLGGGPLLEDHRRLAGGDPSIVFHGVVPNVHAWLSAADVFCLPSRWEGLPLSGVEAVATGIPCVFSDIPETHELGSDVADYVPVDDVEALAASLIARAGSRERAGEASVEALRERWGVGRVMATFLDIYDRLMPPDGSGPVDPR